MLRQLGGLDSDPLRKWLKCFSFSRVPVALLNPLQRGPPLTLSLRRKEQWGMKYFFPNSDYHSVLQHVRERSCKVALSSCNTSEIEAKGLNLQFYWERQAGRQILPWNIRKCALQSILSRLMLDLSDCKKDIQAEEGIKIQNTYTGSFPLLDEIFLSWQTSFLGLGAYYLFSSPQLEAKHVLAGMT